MVQSDKKNFISREWIEKNRVELNAEPILMEKATYCLELVSNLREMGLDFLFKGGTSLLLILPKLQRLSIDVDIAIDSNHKDIENILSKMTPNIFFTHFEEDKRVGGRHDKIPKIHYKMYYNSQITNRTDNVLLDVVLKEPKYTDQTKAIVTSFYKATSNIKVRVPTVSSLLGDKLATLAPNTTGISYGIGKELERIKQLFDIGCLFIIMDDIHDLKDSFIKCIEQENEFFGKDDDIESVVDDIIDFARLTNFIDLKGCQENDRTMEIKKGIQNLINHLIGKGRKYSLVRDAKVDAARAAFCAGLIRNSENIKNVADIFRKVRYSAEVDIKILPEILSNIDFPIDFNFIPKLKKSTPKAVMYWSGYFKPELFTGGI